MTRRQGRGASIPWVVKLAVTVVVLAALTLLAAPVGYRLGVLPLRTALLSVLRWGAYAAAAGAGVSALALGYLLARPKGARRGVWVAMLCLVVAGALFSSNMALSIADYGYVLQTGRIVLSGTGRDLLANPEMQQAYLGEVG